MPDEDLFRRVEAVVLHLGDPARSANDRVAPFITIGLIDRIDYYLNGRADADYMGLHWSKARVFAVVVADFTGACLMPNGYEAEIIGNRIGNALRGTRCYRDKVAKIKKNSKGE